MPPTPPRELFYSYAHKDEMLRDELDRHLSVLQHQKLIVGWHDRRIEPSGNWAKKIDEHIKTAHIILLLISSDFIASRYCYEQEMKIALQRHARGEAMVIPIILRPVHWEGAPFGDLQALPRDAKAVTTWDNQDKAFTHIAEEIKKIVLEFRPVVPPPRPPPPPPPPPTLSRGRIVLIAATAIAILWIAITILSHFWRSSSPSEYRPQTAQVYQPPPRPCHKTWPAEGKTYTAERRGTKNDCKNGVLSLEMSAAIFTCSGDPKKSFSATTDDLKAVDDDGIALKSGEKYHFKIDGQNKQTVHDIFVDWTTQTCASCCFPQGFGPPLAGPGI